MIAAVILAAGFSSRMGRPKALLPVGRGGETFLERVVGTISQAELGTIVVVLGSDAPRVRSAISAAGLPVAVVENPDPSRGQLSSLGVALESLTDTGVEAVLVVPVDQPLVSSDTVRRVVEAYRRTGALIVRPCRGPRHGHPVVFDRSLFEELRTADPARGARAVIAAHRAATVDVPTDDEGAFADFDTPADFERMFGPLPEST